MVAPGSECTQLLQVQPDSERWKPPEAGARDIPAPRPNSPVLLPAATYGYQLTVKKAQVRTTHFFSSRSPWKSREQVYQDCTELSTWPLPPLLQLQSFPWGHLGAPQADFAAPASPHLPNFSQTIIIAGNQPSPSHSVGLRGA